MNFTSIKKKRLTVPNSYLWYLNPRGGAPESDVLENHQVILMAAGSGVCFLGGPSGAQTVVGRRGGKFGKASAASMWRELDVPLPLVLP